MRRIAVAGWALALAACGPQIDPVEEAAWRWAQERMAAEGVPQEAFRVREVSIASRTEREAVAVVAVDADRLRVFVVSVVVEGGNWRVRADLVEEFDRQVLGSAQRMREMQERLAYLIQEQAQKGVDVEPLPLERGAVEIEGGVPTVRVQAWLAFFPRERDGEEYVRVVPARPGDRGVRCYIETWTYREGAWRSEGRGALLREVVPPRRP